MASKRLWLVLGLVALLLAAGLVAWQSVRRGAQPFVVTGAAPTTGVAQVGGPFELVDQHGETRRESDFAGRYMLVYFGYTYCPDICPMTLDIMSRALRRLAEDDAEAAAQVVPVFVSVDPERDTVEALAAYAPSFHADLVALTGSPEQVAAAAKVYRVYYAKAEDESAEDYLMDHSSFIYLMGPDGAYVTHFGHSAKPEEIADGLKRHVKS